MKCEDDDESEEGDFDSYDEDDLAAQPGAKMVDVKEEDEEDHVLKQANMVKQSHHSQSSQFLRFPQHKQITL